MNNEIDWRARDDARTLAEAHTILADPKRFVNAKKQMQEMINEEKQKLAGMESVLTGEPFKRSQEDILAETLNSLGVH